MHLNKIKIFIIRELSIQMFFFLFISCSNAKFRKIIFFNFQTPFMRSNKIKIQQPEEYLSSITNCCLILIDLRNMLQLINDFNFIISLQDSMPQKNDNKKLFSSSTFNFFSSKTRFWSLMEMCIHREKKKSGVILKYFYYQDCIFIHYKKLHNCRSFLFFDDYLMAIFLTKLNASENILRDKMKLLVSLV